MAFWVLAKCNLATLLSTSIPSYFKILLANSSTDALAPDSRGYPYSFDNVFNPYKNASLAIIDAAATAI